jgi:hypothetical protein
MKLTITELADGKLVHRLELGTSTTIADIEQYLDGGYMGNASLIYNGNGEVVALEMVFPAKTSEEIPR